MQSVANGQKYENHIAKLIRSKLDKYAKRNKGSGNQWQRKNDIYTELPIAIECKYQQNIKIHEWFEQAENAASITETPILVFANDNHPQDLATLKFSDLLNYMVEIADLRAEVEDLRAPLPKSESTDIETKILQYKVREAELSIEPAVKIKVERGAKTCRAGHIADQWSYCMQLDCKYSRGYKIPKKKKGKL